MKKITRLGLPRKTEQILIAISPDQKAEIQASAASQGKTVTDYLLSLRAELEFFRKWKDACDWMNNETLKAKESEIAALREALSGNRELVRSLQKGTATQDQIIAKLERMVEILEKSIAGAGKRRSR